MAKCNEQDCIEIEEESRWVTGGWSQCSKSCSGGKKKRDVKCQIGNTKVSNSECASNEKPDEIKQCNTDKCPEWIIGEWNECSQTCNSGTQYR